MNDTQPKRRKSRAKSPTAVLVGRYTAEATEALELSGIKGGTPAGVALTLACRDLVSGTDSPVAAPPNVDAPPVEHAAATLDPETDEWIPYVDFSPVVRKLIVQLTTIHGRVDEGSTTELKTYIMECTASAEQALDDAGLAP